MCIRDRYITRFEKGKEYPIYTRKKDSLTAAEEILFDCNKMAEGHDYFKLVGMNISPDNTKVIYGIDIESRRKYTLHVKNPVSGEVMETKISNTFNIKLINYRSAIDKKIFFSLKNDCKI